MFFQLIAEQKFGDMSALWYQKENLITFTLIPSAMKSKIAQHRLDRNDEISVRGFHRATGCNIASINQESTIQYKVAGDGFCGGFSAGVCMRNSKSLDHLQKPELRISQDRAEIFQNDDRGLVFHQVFQWRKDSPLLKISTSVKNTGNEEIMLEYVSSFSLGLLSLFQPDDGPDCYEVFRWLSNWSNEGRLERRAAEEHGLESSWSGGGVRSLRFGEQGSMPVRGFFPQIGFRDKKAEVCWGCVLDADSSWELELSRTQDFFNLSGGFADREFGQWSKVLKPGESYVSPDAFVTCVCGDVEDLQNRLVRSCDGYLPESEKDLPVMFNEWCTTWGKPYPENLLPIADRLAGRDIRYFVLDAGWFKNGIDDDWSDAVGDWNISPLYDPMSLKAFLAELRKKGFIPGIWFEFEIATVTSRLFKEHPEMFLKLDGKILQSGNRAFLDFRRSDVQSRLKTKVIDFLKENGIGYMKVDYNAPIGIGCDGAESKPEALRIYMESVGAFYERIRKELPDLVLEICSSGGHRLSSAWIRRGCMGSFSDAHEGVEIPLIAAGTASLIPLRKNQIWAVLHGSDDETRLCYSLSAGFMGRLCLSGEMAELSPAQNSLVDEAIALYRKAVPVLKNGKNHLHRETGFSWVHPQGYQWFERTDEHWKLIVLHTFRNSPETIRISLEEKWQIEGNFGVKAELGDSLDFKGLKDFCGGVVLLHR